MRANQNATNNEGTEEAFTTYGPADNPEFTPTIINSDNKPGEDAGVKFKIYDTTTSFFHTHPWWQGNLDTWSQEPTPVDDAGRASPNGTYVPSIIATGYGLYESIPGHPRVFNHIAGLSWLTKNPCTQ